MFKEKTVIILGAGASVDSGYPTGEDLIKLIIESDFCKEDNLTKYLEDYNKISKEKKSKDVIKEEVYKLKRTLKQMSPLSIDTFLTYHPKFSEIGKSLIAYELLKAENRDNLFYGLEDLNKQKRTRVGRLSFSVIVDENDMEGLLVDLKEKKYIDEEGYVTDKFKSFVASGCDKAKMELSEKYCDKKDAIIKVLRDSFEVRSGNWYRFLLDALIRDCREPEHIIKNKGLTIVTFNYELSLEFYFYEILKNIEFFNKEGKDYSSEFLSKLNIIHVYGQLGYYAWNRDFCEQLYGKEIFEMMTERKVDSYADSCANNACVYSQSIQVVGAEKWQEHKEKNHIKEVMKAIKEAKNVFILGFGFYPENMNLLEFEESFKNVGDGVRKKIYYTNYENYQKIELCLDNILMKDTYDRFQKYNKVNSVGMANGLRTYWIKSTNTVYDALKKDFDFI